MTLKGGTSQACARCKYQRRKCTSECALAPYFPPDQPKIFQNAHRLFGVSNILKILKDLDPNQKMEAMRSIIYQANIRDKFPVHGCLGVIMEYQYQIRQVEEELNVIHAQLALYRQHEMLSTPNETSQLQLGMIPASNTLALFHQETTHHYTPVSAFPISSHPSSSHSVNANLSPENYVDSKDNNIVNSFWIQQPCSSDNNQIAIQASQPPTIQQGVVQDYELFDDRQSYIDSKQAYESSSESSLKDATPSLEYVADNELKSAAACFSLAEDELKDAAACFSLAEDDLKDAAACFSLTSVN